MQNHSLGLTQPRFNERYPWELLWRKTLALPTLMAVPLHLTLDWVRWSRPGIVLFVCVLLALVPGLITRAEDGQAIALLREKCAKCHGDKFSGNPTMSFHDLATLSQSSLLVPGKPDESLVYKKIRDGEMPEDKELPDAEKELIRSWIASGAPGLNSLSITERKLHRLDDAIQWIQIDLSELPREDRRYKRYISLIEIANDSRVSEGDIISAKVAVSKIVNSLSFESSIARPIEVGSAKLLLRIDLRDYGWSVEKWSLLERAYPYGLKTESRVTADPLTSADSLNQQMQVVHSYLRADWLVDTLPRPHFYHLFLDLPHTVQELEKQLGIDARLSLSQGRAMHAGFATSKVSVGNRLLQRYRGRYGSYWKSFDFGEERASGNIFRRPFSEAVASEEEPFVLVFDGGEMIFHLPNGLQGFFLSDADGRRLDRGPISVVRDERQAGGTAEVVNAISCMHCHASGMIDFEDSVRAGHVLSGALARRVRELYPPKDQMQKMVEADRETFLEALTEVVGEWGDSNDFRFAANEPVGKLARKYQQDIDIATAAAELGIPTEALKLGIAQQESLLRLGLKPLTQGDKIKRNAWADRSSFLSPMQATAKAMRIAIPSN